MIINLEDLKRENETLRLGDEFMLAGMLHRVCGSYIKNLESNSNVKIFQVLKIRNRVAFCRKAYGYKPRRRSNFPESKGEDFEALTRVTLALFEESLKVSQKRTFFGFIMRFFRIKL